MDLAERMVPNLKESFVAWLTGQYLLSHATVATTTPSLDAGS